MAEKHQSLFSTAYLRYVWAREYLEPVPTMHLKETGADQEKVKLNANEDFITAEINKTREKK